MASISAIVLISSNIDRLRVFYEDILDIEFKEESHGRLTKHYFSILNDCRFILHKPDGYKNLKLRQGSLSLSFRTNSFEEVISKLQRWKATIISMNAETFGKLIEFKDPDGNVVLITELRTKN
jgi:hypothetical protein